MNAGGRRRYLGLVMATFVLSGCAASGSGSPAASSLDLEAVTSALRSAGIAVADVMDNLNPRDGAWRCLPGSFRLARVSQQPPAAVSMPGDKPAVDILLFASDAARTESQSAIGADGQVQAQGCAMMVEWVATPHVFGVRNILLVIATNDPAALAAMRAAAARLGR